MRPTDVSIKKLAENLCSARKAGDTQETANILKQLIAACQTDANTSGCISYSEELIELLRQMKDPRELARQLMNLSQYYIALPDNDSALEALQEAKAIFETLDNQLDIARVNVSTGELLRVLGHTNECLSHLNTALQIFEKHTAELEKPEHVDDKLAFVGTLNTLGLIYNRLSSPQKARLYLERALALNRQLNHTVGTMQTLINLGVSYSRESSTKTFKFYREALQLAESIGNQQYIAILTNNIGSVHEDIEEYDKALEYYKCAIEISEKHNLKRYHSFFNKHIGEVHLKTGLYGKAIERLQLALDLARRDGLRGEEGETLELMYKVCKQTGDFERALEYYEEHIRIHNEIQGENTQQQIERITAEFEVKLHRRETETLRHKNAELEEANLLLKEHRDELLMLERKNTALAVAVTAHHEINQPLMVIKGHLDMLIFEAENEMNNEIQLRHFERIDQSISKITSLLTRYSSSELIDFTYYSPTTQMAIFDTDENDE